MLQSGQILRNRYYIRRQLGQGGMGAVYLAHDTTLKVECVVKELLIPFGATQGSARDAVQSFQAEAFTLAKLRHAQIPRVTDYFDQVSSYFLVMDYVDGDSLDSLIGSGLPEATALDYADQILRILEYVHGEGVVHRDIKPENIIVRRADGRPCLVDFGISKSIAMPTIMFAKGMGTPPYAPLEQYSGGTDERSDIYAMAATLYEMVTGQKPEEAMNRQAGAKLEAPNVLKPSISRSSSDAILKGMTLDRNGRFQTAAAFRDALKPVKAPVRRALIMAAAVVGVLACAGFLVVAWLASASVPPPSPAPTPPAASAVPTRIAAATPVPDRVVTVIVTTPPKVVTEGPKPVTSSPAVPTVTPRPQAPSIIVRDRNIGQSAGGRSLQMTEIGHESGDGPVIVFVGQIAGEQSDTRTVVDEAIRYYRAAPGSIPTGVLLRFIPTINPDGGGLRRLNDHGVDLNRNWQSHNWRTDPPIAGVNTPGAGGSSPFSEPETRALRDLLLEARRSGRRPALIVLHSSAQPGRHYVYAGYTRDGPDTLSTDLGKEVARAIGGGTFVFDSSNGPDPTTGEAIAWCAENNIAAVDIFWSRLDGNRPSASDMSRVVELASDLLR